MIGHSRSQSRVPTVWVPMGSAVVCLAVLSILAVGGCGSVADVGSGASRAGVEPVRGTYGYGSSYSENNEARQKRVEALARSNEKPGKKSARAAEQLKQLPDEEGQSVAEVTLEPRAGLGADAKARLIVQERQIAPTAAQGVAAAGDYGDYEE
jgi:hypothetical protein